MMDKEAFLAELAKRDQRAADWLASQGDSWPGGRWDLTFCPECGAWTGNICADDTYDPGAGFLPQGSFTALCVDCYSSIQRCGARTLAVSGR